MKVQLELTLGQETQVVMNALDQHRRHADPAESQVALHLMQRLEGSVPAALEAGRRSEFEESVRGPGLAIIERDMTKAVAAKRIDPDAADAALDVIKAALSPADEAPADEAPSEASATDRLVEDVAGMKASVDRLEALIADLTGAVADTGQEGAQT
jgi:hypothetical protein